VRCGALDALGSSLSPSVQFIMMAVEHKRMVKLIMIAAGGAFGTLLRYLVAGWGQRLSSGSFPTGTLTVNVTGCLLIGFLGALFAGPYLVRDEYRVAVLVGVLGSFTTFSTFSAETFALLNDRQVGYAVVNVLLSNGLGFIAVWFGYRLAERWFGV